MIRAPRCAAWISIFATFASAPLFAQQKADPDFKATVTDPAYSDSHPKVLFDEAHYNFHTATGRYKPFADLITHDGCHITPNTRKFDKAALKGFDVLIIANALGAERMGTADAQNPAFTDKECDAVRDWVKAGGALLLITDHYPIGSANETLARRFGIDMSKGMTEEYEFTPETGLGDHPILRGRSEAERIRKVATFTGQSLKGPAGGAAFLSLPDDAVEKVPDPKNPWKGKPQERPARGRCQGLALPFGKGRVVCMGEAAMLTAQLDPQGGKFGMNVDGIDNRQLALNIMHWLTGLLDSHTDGKKSP